MIGDPLDHALNGQEQVTGAGTYDSGPYYGLKVITDMVVSAMEWEPAYGRKCGDTDWSDQTKLIPGYYPGRVASLTVTSGTGILFKV